MVKAVNPFLIYHSSWTPFFVCVKERIQKVKNLSGLKEVEIDLKIQEKRL